MVPMTRARNLMTFENGLQKIDEMYGIHLRLIKTVIVSQTELKRFVVESTLRKTPRKSFGVTVRDSASLGLDII